MPPSDYTYVIKRSNLVFTLISMQILFSTLLFYQTIESVILSYIIVMLEMIIIPGYFAKRFLLSEIDDFFSSLSLSIIIGLSTSLISSIVLLSLDYYQNFWIIFFPLIISIAFGIKEMSKFRNDLYNIKLDFSRINFIIAISSCLSFILRYLYYKNILFISDRYSEAMTYNIEYLIREREYKFLPFDPPFITATFPINFHAVFYSYKILNSTFIISSGQSAQHLLHVPLFATFVFPIVIASIGELLIKSEYLNVNKNLPKYIFLIFLFIPSNYQIIGMEVTAGGIFGLISYCIFWTSLGLKFRFLFISDNDLSSLKIIQYGVVFLLIDFLLITGYWSHAFYFILTSVVLSLLYLFTKNPSMNKLFNLLLSNFLLIAYQVEIFLYVLNKQNWYILPTQIKDILPEELIRGTYFRLLVYSLYWGSFILFLLIRKLINNSNRITLKLILYKNRNFSLKYFIISQAIIAAILCGMVVYLRYFWKGPEGKENYINFNYYNSNEIYILSFLRYLEIAMIMMIFVILINLITKSIEDSFIPLNSFMNPLFLSVYLSFVIFSIPIFLALGGLTVLIRAINYMFVIPITLCMIYIFSSDFQLKYVTRNYVKYILVGTLISIIVISQLIVGLTFSRNNRLITSFYNEELEDLDLLYSHIEGASIVYTDNRLRAGFVSYFDNTNIIDIDERNVRELEKIWYTDNATLAHIHVNLEFQMAIKYILLSTYFIEVGIFGYDFLLESLTEREYLKFFNSANSFSTVFKGSSLSLIAVNQTDYRQNLN